MGNKANKESKTPDNEVNSTSHSNQHAIPNNFRDPITNKIMAKPTMILSSMQVYDDLTITKWIKSKRNFDPITGFPVAINGWPLLLEQRPDIKRKIDQFLNEYPSLKTEQFSEDDEKSIEWESLFKAHELKVKQKYDQIMLDQANLRIQSKQIFKCSEAKQEDMVEIVYDDKIILQPDIPVVCIMGPSRNGKSTIVNDILGVKDAFKTSTKSDVPLTKGAWIARYSSNKDDEGIIMESKDEDENKEAKYDEFYLLDMEGLSHNVTQFTKRLFYACYATANVIIWNDKSVASDEFRNLMKELQTEMKAVATSRKKPAFMYLKRDAGDYDYDPFNTFDDYINKNESFQWFREMNVFSSLSAYELDRPSKDKNVRGLNFHSLQKNRDLLPPLIKEIAQLCNTSKRFSENMWILKQQICHINKSTALNMTMQYVLDNDILKLFILPAKGLPERRRDMVFAACEFDWDHEILDQKYNEEIKKMEEVMINIDPLVVDRLNTTKKELFERIKNKQASDEQWGKRAKGSGAVIGGIVGALAGGVFFAATISTGGIVGIVALGLGGAGALVGWGLGYGAQKTRESYKKWTNGNYMKYRLGRTDQERKLDSEREHEKSKMNHWEYWSRS
eukprot:460552_1